MNRFFTGRICVLALLLLTLTGCREFTTVDRPYQRVLINDFSAPLRTLLPAHDDYPNSIRLRVNGAISRPVVLTVNLLTVNQVRQFARRDTLAAGAYVDKDFGGDFYSKEETELVVTGAPGTTGSLSIDWYVQ